MTENQTAEILTVEQLKERIARMGMQLIEYGGTYERDGDASLLLQWDPSLTDLVLAIAANIGVIDINADWSLKALLIYAGFDTADPGSTDFHSGYPEGSTLVTSTLIPTLNAYLGKKTLHKPPDSIAIGRSIPTELLRMIVAANVHTRFKLAFALGRTGLREAKPGTWKFSFSGLKEKFNEYRLFSATSELFFGKGTKENRMKEMRLFHFPIAHYSDVLYWHDFFREPLE